MPAKVHKKTSWGSPTPVTKESYAKQMISFIENKNETSRRSILQLFEAMSQIDLTKIPLSKIKNSTLLYIKTLNELMERINKNKIVFRVTPVVFCAQMIAETARILCQTSSSGLDIFNLLMNNEKKIIIPSENDIHPFPLRKIQKVHSYSPLLAFIIKHYPQAGNIFDIFSYAVVTMLERMKLKALIPNIIPSFPPEKYKPLTPESFDCAEVTPDSLLEIARRLKSPMDPILVLLVRFISCKIFGSYEFKYLPENELLDAAFEFLEENPEYDIDSLTPLLLYYSSYQVNFPIHLTYTSVNHCLFFICIGLRNLFEPTTNDILLTTISFENAPCPSLALVFAHNLSASFIPEFISHALKNDLSPEWNDEIKYLLQYVKMPPKREDLIEQSKTNNLDAIKLLLKDPECVPLLKPEEYQSHKLLSLFLNPIKSPLPERINFDRYGAAFIYQLKSLKDCPDQNIISNYIHQAAKELSKITHSITKNDKSLFHAIYSGIQPALSTDPLEQPIVPPPPLIKKINSAEFFFSPITSPEFENLSIIIDNLLSIIHIWKFNFDNNQEIIQIAADFNHHYYLTLNHLNRCLQLFEENYKKAYEWQPFDHFIQAFQEETSKDKQNNLITLFKSIICSQVSQDCMLNFIKKLYELKNKDAFIKIIKMMPSIASLETTSTTISNEELLDIVKILINAEISKNVIQISTKLIESGFSKQVYQLFLSSLFDHPEVMTSICHNLPNCPDFAEYFFNNSLDIIPNEISCDLSDLIFLLSQQIKPYEYDLPTYPKIKANDIEWKEDKLKTNKSKNNEIEPKNKISEEISISVKKEAKINKPKKITKYKKLHDINLDEEEEEEEEEIIDDTIDNNIIITSSSSQKGQNYEFPFSSKNCPSIWEIPNLKHCTFIETGRKYVQQPFFRCLTCDFGSNEGACEYCAIHCHKGHQIYFDGNMNCFCDCFADASRCISNPDHNNHTHGFHTKHTHNNTGALKKTTLFGYSSKSRPSNNNDDRLKPTFSSSRNDKPKINLSSKCIIYMFLKIARTKFLSFEIDNINTLQLKQLKSIRGFSQFNLSPNFSFPQTPSYSQLRKRISRVKNLSSLLERRSSLNSISLACNIGDDIICYSNGSGLYASKITKKTIPKTGFFSSQPSPSSTSATCLPFDECIYSIVSSGDSLVACLCDSMVKIVKITKEPQTVASEQQNNGQPTQNPPPSDNSENNQQTNQQQQQQQNQENNQSNQGSMIQHLRQRLNSIQSQFRNHNQNQSQNQPKFKFEILTTLSAATTTTVPTFSFSSSSSSTQRSSIFINAIFVNNSLIIILTGSSITTYNLPEGNQISSIKANQIPFTSICLFNYNKNPYILAGNSEGQLIVYLLSSQGNLTLDHIVEIERPSSSVIVSCSQEDDLIFISSDRLPLSVCRPSDLFSSSLSTVQIDGITTAVFLSCRYKNHQKEETTEEAENENNKNNQLDEKKDPAVFLFTKTKNGSICSLEFTSNSFVVSSLNDEFRSDDSGQPSYLGSFDTKNGFFILSSEGVFLKISLNDDRAKMLRSQSNEFSASSNMPSSSSSSSSLSPDSVPVTFWSRSIMNSRDYVRLYTNELDDASSLLDGRTINVPQSLTLRFTARPISNDYTIVGIRIFTLMSSSSPSQRCAEFNGRSYLLGGSAPTCIPLRPSEVHPGSPVNFTIMPGGGMMILRSINIHCMRTDELTVPRFSPLKLKFDWINESTNLFDFCEDSLNQISKDNLKAQIELNLARGFNDDGTIDEECMKLLIVTMYECGEEAALQSRLILVRLKFDHDVLQKIWADSIGEVVKKKSVHKSQINALWRDFTLLDSRFKGEIQNLVWNNVQEQSGLSCLLSAFY